jgi:hypothetical protein
MNKYSNCGKIKNYFMVYKITLKELMDKNPIQASLKGELNSKRA